MSAQVPLYPVHQQEKWGFIAIWGGKPELTIPSKYDYLSSNISWHSLQNGSGSRLSPFRLFEQNQKVGLLNDSLQEILPARYEYIFPLTRRYFAVRSDSMLTLVRANDVPVLQERFDDIFALDIDYTSEIQYIMVTKNKQQGVFSVPEGRLLFEPKFGYLELAHKSGLFKIKDLEAKDQKQNWGLADKNGTIILPCRYADINILNSKLFAVKNIVAIVNDSTHQTTWVDKWKIVTDRVEKEEQYDQIRRLNSHWALAINNGEETTAMLWSLDSTKIVKHAYRMIQRMDEDYLLGVTPFGLGKCLLKNDLRPAVDSTYARIESSGLPGIYRVERNSKWGLIMPAQSRTPVLSLMYDGIQDFKDSIALVVKNKRRGAINFKFDTIVPCIFFTLEQEGPRLLKGQIDEDENFKIIALDQFFNFKNAITSIKNIENITILNDQVWFEAKPRSPYGLPETRLSDDLYWPKWGDFWIEMPGFLSDKSRKNAFPMVVNQVVGVVSTTKMAKIPYAIDFRENNLFEITMHNINGKRLVGSPVMVGCMPFKMQVPYTVFIDSTGAMGLVNRQGQQGCDSVGQPLRFTYIGPFNCGLANVCVGGRLVYEKAAAEKVFSLGNAGSFEQLFGWQGKSRSSINTRDYNYYVETSADNPAHWGIIDTSGRFLVVPTFDYISHYYLADSLAKVGKYGANKSDPLIFSMINTKGKVLFPPKYQNIIRHRNYFISENKGTPKYIFDAHGQFIMKMDTLPQGYRSGFAEGVSAELDSNGYYGYIDTLGHFVLPGQYTRARNFSEGLAAVCVDTSEFWCFIDRNGQIAFQTTVPKNQESWLGNFKGNRCYFREKAKPKYGYYDRKGEQIIKPSFKSTSNFSKGVAVVTSVDKQAKVEIPGTIDSMGVVLLKTSMLYKKIWPFNNDGTALAQIRESGKYTMLSSIGEPVTELYDSITTVLNGFAKVRLKNKWGLINGTGKVCLPIEFIDIDTVSEGMVAAKSNKNGYWNYFDTDGHKLPVDNLVETHLFKDGYAQAIIKDTSSRKFYQVLIDHQGNILSVPGGMPMYYTKGVFVRSTEKNKDFADEAGNELVESSFSEIQPVNPDLFIVKNYEKQWGAVNRHGMIIIPLRYNRLLSRRWYLQGFTAKLRGLVSRDGRELLPPEYEMIEEMTNGIFKVTRGGEVGYFDLKKGWIWALQK